jgi:hypothetical protein
VQVKEESQSEVRWVFLRLILSSKFMGGVIVACSATDESSDGRGGFGGKSGAAF